MHTPQGLSLILLLIHPPLHLLFELGEFQLDAQHSPLLTLQLSLCILQDTQKIIFMQPLCNIVWLMLHRLLRPLPLLG